jgi:hypothetical protein
MDGIMLYHFRFHLYSETPEVKMIEEKYTKYDTKTNIDRYLDITPLRICLFRLLLRFWVPKWKPKQTPNN